MVALRALAAAVLATAALVPVARAQTVTQMPAASLPLTGQESLYIIQNGQPRKVGPAAVAATSPTSAMRPDASNATLPLALQSLGLQIPASCDGFHSYTANMTSGSAILTDNGATFTPADVDKLASVAGAGSTKFFGTATIVGGGAGHTVGEEIPITGGTGTAGTIIVRSVSGGVITGISGKPLALGKYTAVPSNPVTVGDATITVTWNNDNLVTTIASFTSSHQVNLAATAGNTVTNTLWGYGTDHATEINAAISANSPFHLPPNSICGVASTISLTTHQMLLGYGTGGAGISPSQLMWLGAVDGTVLKANNGGRVDGIQLGPVGINGLCAASKIVELHGVVLSDLNFLAGEMKDIGVDLNMSDDGLTDTYNNRFTRGGAAANEARCSQSATGVLFDIANNLHDVNNNSFSDLEVLHINGIGLDIRQGYLNTFYNPQIFRSVGGVGPSMRLGASNTIGSPNLSARSNSFDNMFSQADILGEIGSVQTCVSNTIAPLNVGNTAVITNPVGCMTINLVSTSPNTYTYSGTTLIGNVDSTLIQTNYRTNSTNSVRNLLNLDLQNSAGARKTYAGIGAFISSNAAGAEQGALQFYVANAGVAVERGQLFPNGALAIGTTAPTKAPCVGCFALDNASIIQSLDSGGTLRSVIQMFSDNKTYLDGGSAGWVVRTNNSGATSATGDATGNVKFAHGTQLAAATAATILAITCNAAAEGTMYSVTDANSAVFNAAVAAGGANHMIAYCNGSAWVVH